VQGVPRHRRRLRQPGQRPGASAAARAQRQGVVVEQVGQALRGAGREQCTQRRTLLARGKQFEACQRLILGQHRWHDVRRIGGILQRGGEHGCGQPGPGRRVALLQRRAQRPLVDLGGEEQQVAGRGQRQGDAARVRPRGQRRFAPAEVGAGTGDALAPAFQERGVGRHANDFEHRTGVRKEKIGAGQAARIGVGQGGRGIQSSISGAIRMPRSSRIRPSRLKSAAAGASAVRAVDAAPVAATAAGAGSSPLPPA